MSQSVYLNGHWLTKDQAAVSVEDRGFMFADGVYEVVRYYNGRPFAMDAHVERLQKSLKQVRLELPSDTQPLDSLSDDLMRRNDLTDGHAYWQVTRGAAPRKHPFPSGEAHPTVLMVAYPDPPMDPRSPVPTMRAVTHPDQRWSRCEIKSLMLLPNVLARQAAADVGCDEAILVRDGTISEGTARSICIVDKGRVRTHPLDGRILGSITRRVVLDQAREMGLTVEEDYFSLEQLLAADEVLAVGTTTQVASIVKVDGRAVGEETPGPVATCLSAAYRELVAHQCGVR